MANHKSSLKRIRSNAAKRLRNRYQAKTTRNAIKKLRGTTTKADASVLLVKVISMLDRLAKKNVIHKNKASNNKSKLTKFVNNLKEYCNKYTEKLVFSPETGFSFLKKKI